MLMPKFTFTCEHASGEKITFESDKEIIYDVINDFGMFLRGSGFNYSGELDIVPENFYVQTDSFFL